MRDLVPAEREDLKAQRLESNLPGSPHKTEQAAVPSKRPSPKQVLQMQRTQGNQAVQRMLANVQRQDPEPSAGTGAPAAGGPTTIGDGSAQITAKNGQVEITGSMVSINAPMVQNSGLVSASTVQADSVIAASYSPGAGNLW